MSEHTPLPWSVNREAGGVTYIMAGDSYLATMGYVSNSDEELAANARLMAATPDLLEALKACPSLGCLSPELTKWWTTIARPAVAKATAD